jgi:single-strand DNA-binding protein
MSDVNQVVLIGRLTRDAELKTTANGTAVNKFSIAVNEKRKVGDEWKDNANFFEIVLWGKVGESIHPYLTKGKQIAITGKLTQERWEQDGVSRQKVVVTAANIQLLGGSSNDGSSGQGNKSPAAPAPAADDGFADEIPF